MLEHVLFLLCLLDVRDKLFGTSEDESFFYCKMLGVDMVICDYATSVYNFNSVWIDK